MAARKASERRRHRRYDVQDVSGTMVVSLDATIQNVSLTGMAIETTSRLRVGGTYTVRLPREGDPLPVPVEVQWCILARTEKRGGDFAPIYRAGLLFGEILTEKAREVLRFIEKHASIEVDDRITGRFRVKDVEQVNVDEQAGFSVKRVSLSGVLIEAQARPDPGALLDLDIRPGDDAAIHATGRVAYVNDRPVDGNAKRCEVGVEFVALSAEARLGLQSFIKRLIE